MRGIRDLYELAEQECIDIDLFPLSRTASLSMPLPDGGYGIAINPDKIQTSEDETVLLAHELGHCMTGSFYNRWSTFDVRQKHENCADKWAIEQLVTKEDLGEAINNGYTQVWDLAEYFNVSEDFIKKAICWYRNGNLDTSHYF